MPRVGPVALAPSLSLINPAALTTCLEHSSASSSGQRLAGSQAPQAPQAPRAPRAPQALSAELICLTIFYMTQNIQVYNIGLQITHLQEIF